LVAAADDATQGLGLQLMRGGIRLLLQAVVSFCYQEMDYRFAQTLELLDRHAEHLLGLMCRIQTPYLLKGATNGNPDPIDEVERKAACVVARDWLLLRGFSRRKPRSWC
jgi:hypothetical protein